MKLLGLKFGVGLLGLIGCAAATGEVVVLTNGQLLEGRVEVLGSQVLVDTGTSQVRLSRREVETVVKSKLELYEQRRQGMGRGGAVAHARLADWCLSEGLLPQAAREINDARTHQPTLAGLESLEARLLSAMRQQAPAEPSSPTPPAATSVAENDELAELERFAAELDPRVLEQFTRNIQPIVVQNCGTVGCHSSNDAAKFQVNRDLVHGMSNRRSTLRNLRATLSLVDKSNPQSSPLVQVPASPHADLTGPVFRGRNQNLLDKLLAWSQLAAGPSDQGIVAEINDPSLQPAGFSMYDDGLGPPSQYLAAAPSQPAVPQSPQPSAKREVSHFWEVEQPAATRTAPTMIDGPAPIRDEFDPEIFNRRFGSGQ